MLYENTPIQIYWKFYNKKRKMFRQKILIQTKLLNQDLYCLPCLQSIVDTSRIPDKAPFFLVGVCEGECVCVCVVGGGGGGVR